MRPEARIEETFKKHLESWFKVVGVEGVVLKLTILGFAGWPDRLILWQGGNLAFIEFKQPGETPRALQLYVHRLLESMGFIVEVHDDWRIALDSIKEKVRASLRADPGHEAHRQ